MTKRALFADFENYTGGDAEFQKELIALMINNLEELRASAVETTATGNFNGFRAASHKVNSTLDILNDEEFSALIIEVKSEQKMERVADIITMCDKIIESLQEP